MKTAVSIPDSVFRRADQFARMAGRSRSAVYAAALEEYLARHEPDAVTRAMNRVVEQGDDPNREFVGVAARRVLERTEW